jgi:predicted XRE-type DNA-binding protein
MKAQDLKQINSEIRRMVSEYIKTNNITLTEFARKSGIHQSHLSVFMNLPDSKKGFNSNTIEKIGKFLSD